MIKHNNNKKERYDEHYKVYDILMLVVLILPVFFPLLCYAGDNSTDTITVSVNNHVYKLITSIDTSRHDADTANFTVCIKLTRDGRTIREKNFPLTRMCPIEEDIRVEGFDNGFIIRIPYCDGYMFRFGEARFVYSNKQEDFILAAYREEIIDRQHPEQKVRYIKYKLPEIPITLSGFSPCSIRNRTDTFYYNNDTISQELTIRKINQKKIYFVLSSQNIHQKQKNEYKGYASTSEYAGLASETDFAEDGSLYPVIEYWCEDAFFPFSIRINYDMGVASISFAKEVSLPYIYQLKSK